ncbi:MAG: hypothetical protein LJE84_06465 [Gammaproteobacteria bacterium]|nr:hypothetical protein [Gammaproteobacteria bacterium]
MKSSIGRRDFVRLCLNSLAAAGIPQAAAAAARTPLKTYSRSLLVNRDGDPVRVADIEEGQSFIFNYPYVSTPCFLLNLGEPVRMKEALTTESGKDYQWQGGVGPRQAIVAFSAICAHKMTHPAKSVSFINYRQEKVRFLDKDKQLQERAGVIFCCSEKSVYDPSHGAKVLGGPAKQPLTAIALEFDPSTDQLRAIGTHGGELYQQFFAKFGFRLGLEFRTAKVDRLIADSTEVFTLAEYSRQTVLC